MSLKFIWQRTGTGLYTTAFYWSRTPARDIEATTVLHPDEYQRYVNFPAEARRSSFLRGRYCVKQALRYYLPQPAHELSIGNGVFQQPFLLDNQHNIGVSLAHSVTAAVGIAFPEQYPMAIDVEEWQSDLPAMLEHHWTGDEQRLINQAPHPYQPLLFWSAKEALAKVLKTGLTLPAFILEITEQKQVDRHQVFHFRHFSQYKALLFSGGKYVVALVVPARSELVIQAG